MSYGAEVLLEPVTARRLIGLASSVWPWSGHGGRGRLSRRAMTCPPAPLDPRRRRIKFRAWHRGTREMDLLMGRFADAELAGLTHAELDDLERLMEAPDRDMFAWLSGETVPPAEYDTPMFRKVQAFHSHVRPLYG